MNSTDYDNEEHKKLSELIREGAKLRPQCTGDFFQPIGGIGLGSCAFGAAYEALGGKASAVNTVDCIDYIQKELDIDLTNEYSYSHPETEEYHSLDEIIPNLNDDWDWSREQIADWLEGLGF